jgi:LysM repeat protein
MFFDKSLLRKFRLATLVGLLGLGSCIEEQPALTPSASARLILTPYSSPLPGQEPTSVAPKVLTPTNPPPPTPTPVTYTIVAGDTMLAIALRHGIELEDLQAANPDVNPRLLSVGTVLEIPLGESLPAVPMTATPLPLPTASPDCYAVPDGTWCFMNVTNDRSRPIENISGRIVLYDQEGQMIADGVGIAPLNLLPEDETIPLVAFFPGRQAGVVTAFADLISAQTVPKNDERYLNAWIEVNQVDLSTDRMQAKVRGSFGIPKKSASGNLVWIAAVAHDSDGRIAGVRKLELNIQIEPGDSQDFTLEVYSLGPQITEVNVLIEARP